MRQSVQQLEKVLGAEDVDTLSSKYWMAVTLHKQERIANLSYSSAGDGTEHSLNYAQRALKRFR